MTPARDAGGAATEATPEMVVAAWRVFRGERPGMLLGPGPGFAEAISAALAQRAVRPGEAAQHTLHCVLAPRFSRLLAIARRLRVKLDLAESIAGGEITEQEWKSQAEIGRLTRALAASERALAGARASAIREAADKAQQRVDMIRNGGHPPQVRDAILQALPDAIRELAPDATQRPDASGQRPAPAADTGGDDV